MKSLLVIVMCVLLGVFGAVVVAQDEGPTLAGITGDSEAYYGQEVTIEGYVADIVNVKTFILEEGALLGNSQVLVINNSGQEFDLGLVDGQRMTVTGIVHPHYAEGGLSRLSTAAMGTDAVDTVEATPMAEMTEDPAMTDMTEEPLVDATAVPMDDTTMDTTRPDLSTMWLRDDLHNHTIIEITSTSAITYLENE